MRAPLVSLPLALAGMLAAHELAYRGTETASHGYMGLAEMLVCAALAFGLVAAVRGPTGRPPAGLFAACPPLAFLLLESAEHGFDPAFLVEPTLLVGLVAQFPFALVAFGLARLLLRAAEALGRRLRRPRFVRRAAALRFAAADDELRGALLLARAGRGPPSLSPT